MLPSARPILDIRAYFGTLLAINSHGGWSLKECLILLVEDDANDAFFVARALKELGFNGRVHHVTSTQRARDYMSGAGEFQDRQKFPAPEIVISDSALPGRGSGIELLEWMRAQSGLAQAQFVILSGEITPEVRARATKAGVQLLLSKGSNLGDTTRALREALLQMPGHCRPWLKVAV